MDNRTLSLLAAFSGVITFGITILYARTTGAPSVQCVSTPSPSSGCLVMLTLFWMGGLLAGAGLIFATYFSVRKLIE